MKENKFQSELIKELQLLFPGCFVMKTDPVQRQGLPDLLILYKDKWAILECKRNALANRQPNQEYYIKKFGEMSYASFIYPENKEEVFRELQQAFAFRGSSCVSES